MGMEERESHLVLPKASFSLPQCPRVRPYLDVSVDLPLRMQVVQSLGTKRSP